MAAPQPVKPPEMGLKMPDIQYGSPFAQPGRPDYIAGYDPKTMSLLPQVQSRLGNLKGLDALRDRALGTGSSPWASMMTRKQFDEESDARERGKQEARSSANQAMTDLAMRGGLSSGARERATQNAAKNLLSMSQDVGRQGNINRLNIGVQDEQQKMGALSQLPGQELAMEQQWGQAAQTDQQRLLEENRQRNSYNQNTYQQQMQAWAAERQAQATENAGKK